MAATNIIMPQLGESVEEGTVSAWHKQPGDRVAVDEVLLEIETDKVATEVPSLVAGTLTEILVAAGATAKVGATLAVIDSEGAAAAPAQPQPIPPASPPPPSATAAARAPLAPHDPDYRAKVFRRTAPNGTPLSPAVRRLLARHDLDPAAIAGTGRDGRIQRKDVLAYLEAGPAASASAAPSLGASETETMPFSSLRKRIAANMRRSKADSAHVLQAIEADFHAIEQVRAGFKQAWRDKYGGALTYLPFIARAVCLALAEFPQLNGHRDGDNLVLHKRIDLGFAIDLDKQGLLAPVLRDAGAMNVPALARGIADLAERARAGRLSPDDMKGAGYTLTNNGSFGTMITAPIINQPQVAILSTDGVRRRPWVIDGPDGEEIAIRPIGVLAQSFDHCVIDGAYSGSFLNRLKTIIETQDWLREFL